MLLMYNRYVIIILWVFPAPEKSYILMYTHDSFHETVPLKEDGKEQPRFKWVNNNLMKDVKKCHIVICTYLLLF